MKNRTVTLTVAAPLDAVFDFLCDIENLPLWATSYCRSLRQEDGRWIVATEAGELYFAIDCNKSGGCIDMYAGATLDEMSVFPIRLMTVDTGETAVVFSFFKCAGDAGSDAQYEAQYRALVGEARGLAARFGGGDVSAEQTKPSALYPGFVAANLSATKAFYRRHFGFEAVFDSPFYLHLARAGGGEQLGFLSVDAEGGAPWPEFESASRGEGVWISLDVEDVDAEHARLTGEGIAFLQSPLDQPWGERICVLRDPNGILIYMAQKTGAVDPRMAQYYAAAQLAGV